MTLLMYKKFLLIIKIMMFKSLSKSVNRHFIEEVIRAANDHIRRCLSSPKLKGIIKVTMTFQF